MDGAKWFLEFKEMLETWMDETGQCALKIMNLLQLGKIEKGAYSMEGRYKSLQSHGYGVKEAAWGGEEHHKY